jgi:hypothetical protein
MIGTVPKFRSLFVAIVVGLASMSSPELTAERPEARPSEGLSKKSQNKTWPPLTIDGQPDISGTWGGFEHGTWTVWLENTYYLYSKMGMTPMSAGDNKGPGSPASFFTKRESAITDPSDGILPYQPWALQRRNSVMKDYLTPAPWQTDTQTPGWPTGIPRENAYSSTDGFYGGPIQILQPPGYVIFLYETHHEFRVVPLDGRSQPGQDIKMWTGSSRGRWDGNTLVIDVANNNDSPRMSVIGDFRSDQMHATERWTFLDKDTIGYQCTVNDPKVFTRPWTMTLTFKRAPSGTELMEYAGVEGAAPFFGFTKPNDPRNSVK